MVYKQKEYTYIFCVNDEYGNFKGFIKAESTKQAVQKLRCLEEHNSLYGKVIKEKNKTPYWKKVI